MNAIAQIPDAPVEDGMYVQLAREIAMDIDTIESILLRARVTETQWNEIKENAYFQQLLKSAVQEWQGASNTAERVKLKALACIEVAMPEFFARMHDKSEALPAKVKSLEVFANLAGMSKGNVQAAGPGERFSVTINLGQDQQLKVSAPATPQIIDVAPRDN